MERKMDTRPFKTADNPFAGARPDAPLEKRVGDLEDVAALNRMITAYTAYCDRPFDAEGFASLFTEDGVWENDYYGPQRGRDEIRDFIKTISGEIVWACHQYSNPDVQVSEDGRSAIGTWYLILMDDVREEDGSITGYLYTVDYQNTFVKQDGTWYLQHCNPYTKSETRMPTPWKTHD
jgi:uncharacterized protein (TIGR02246 family)